MLQHAILSMCMSIFSALFIGFNAFLSCVVHHVMRCSRSCSERLNDGIACPLSVSTQAVTITCTESGVPCCVETTEGRV